MPILPLRGAIETNEIPVTLKSLVRQMMMWANTGIEISVAPLKFLRQIRKNNKSIGAFLFFTRAYFKRIVLNFEWGVLPILTLYFIVIGHYIPVLIVFCNLALMGLFGSYVLKNKCNIKQNLIHVIIGIILFYLFVYPIGFFLAVTSKVIYPFYKISKPSTER